MESLVRSTLATLVPTCWYWAKALRTGIAEHAQPEFVSQCSIPWSHIAIITEFKDTKAALPQNWGPRRRSAEAQD